MENSKRLPTTAPDSGFVPEGLHRAPKILVVDDDAGIRKLLQLHLKRSGCQVEAAQNGESALRQVREGEGVDLVLLDLRLPGMSGLATLHALNETGKVGCIIVMTAYGTMPDAIAALKDGAYDFVNKTYSFDDVRMAIRNALQTLGLREEVENLKMRLNEMEGGYTGIIGVSKPFQQVMKLVRKVRDSNITVLIQGQSGTGKELIARAIHFQGQYRQQPFVALNCATIPENLLESELFGHEKGAFTGATARRIGKFEEAHEGTLFLDEIGELNLALQSKLLRVLQSQEIQPIGGKVKHVSVRIISATNQDLLQSVGEGRFRQDLYYRLAVFPISVPTLQQRKEDIPLLIEHFVEKFRRQENKVIRSVAPEAVERLINYPWYGNVRELENVIYRAVVLADSTVLTARDFTTLPPAPSAEAPPGTELMEIPNRGAEADTPSPSGRGGRASLEQLEIEAIQNALAANGGNMSKAAVQLKIGRATLYRKFKKYGIIRT